ncbi:MAG: BON domain-containing protein, partial [Acidimicrobiales bacterium]|nr:BON domain-containing protein [Acidimicrobiales bacterium]
MSEPLHTNDERDDDDEGALFGIGRLASILRARGLPGYVFWFVLVAALIITFTLIASRCDKGDNLPDRLSASGDTAEPASPTPEPAETTEPSTTDAPDLTPIEVVVEVAEDGTVTVTGAVPDQATADAIIAALADTYGADNINDQLTIDDTTTNDGGKFVFRGTTRAAEADLDALVDALGAGIITSELNVDMTDLLVIGPAPASVLVDIAEDGSVTVSGSVPDQATADAIIAALADTYGADNIDDQLTIDATTSTQ